jgi:hypothetical protein
MANSKPTFLILILILIPLLTACGVDKTKPSVLTDTPTTSAPGAALSPPTLLYFWAQW